MAPGRCFLNGVPTGAFRVHHSPQDLFGDRTSTCAVRRPRSSSAEKAVSPSARQIMGIPSPKMSSRKLAGPTPMVYNALNRPRPDYRRQHRRSTVKRVAELCILGTRRRPTLRRRAGHHEGYTEGDPLSVESSPAAGRSFQTRHGAGSTVSVLVWTWIGCCTISDSARACPPGTRVGGWEEPTCEVRGHFVGHYLSACSDVRQHRRPRLKQTSTRLVAGLAECQAGYRQWLHQRLSRRVHRPRGNRQAGLGPLLHLAQDLCRAAGRLHYCGNQQALEVARKAADWVKPGSPAHRLPNGADVG